MSIEVMSSVWKYSRQKGSARLLLLAIADSANESGEAWPGIRSLAKKCATTDRNIQKLIKQIEAAGELLVVEGGGMETPNGPTNKFIVVTPGIPLPASAKQARPVNTGTPVKDKTPVYPSTDTGERQGRRPVNAGTPNPSVNRKLTQSGGDARPHEAAGPPPPTPQDPTVASLVRSGLTPRQAIQAAPLYPYTSDELAALEAWADRLRKKHVNPGAVLWGYAQYGLLPEDIPKARKKSSEPRLANGQIDYHALSDMIANDPSYYRRSHE
jgi:hypothetical protein